MRIPADRGLIRVVVKDFGAIEMHLPGEQHPHNQGVYPILVPVISQTSQMDRRALNGF
jgi:hypothetical protein